MSYNLKYKLFWCKSPFGQAAGFGEGNSRGQQEEKVARGRGEEDGKGAESTPPLPHAGSCLVSAWSPGTFLILFLTTLY